MQERHSEFVDHIASALIEYLKVTNQKIAGDRTYKFNMKIEFDVRNEEVKKMSIKDVEFCPLIEATELKKAFDKIILSK